ncbi:unnamed protein product [Rhizoctonia solani]|uniref:Uncharacterized protein n=1 Tax=Rhizoctonia solani TaxID=456999 RepID=A0A8H2WFL0_9AGAM|nr:unnamed protein product [Rhizoctonia solani]
MDSYPVPILWASRNVIPNEYIVRLKDDADMISHFKWLEQYANDGLSKCIVTGKFEAIKGYGAELSGPVLEDLTRRHDVKRITQECETECASCPPTSP